MAGGDLYCMPTGLVGGFPYETWRGAYGSPFVWTAKFDLTPDGSSGEAPIRRFSNTIIALVAGGKCWVSQDGGVTFAALTPPNDQFNGNVPFEQVQGASIRAGGISFDVNGRLYAMYGYIAATSRISLFYTDNYSTWTYANLTRAGLAVTGGRIDNVECHLTDANYLVCGGLRDDTFAHCCLYISTDKALTWTRYLSGPGFAVNYCHGHWGQNNRVFMTTQNTDCDFYTVDQPWSAVTSRFSVPVGTAQAHEDLIQCDSDTLGGKSSNYFFYMNNPIYRTQDNGTNWSIITESLGHMGNAACYDKGIDVFYASGGELHALASAPTASAGAGTWTQVVMPSGVSTIGRNDLIILPASTPVTPPEGGGGGGPPRFGPFHPTRLQRFNRNVLVKPTPKAIG